MAAFGALGVVSVAGLAVGAAGLGVGVNAQQRIDTLTTNMNNMTLTNKGYVSLVAKGTAPTFELLGLQAGTNITLTTTDTNVIITAAESAGPTGEQGPTGEVGPTGGDGTLVNIVSADAGVQTTFQGSIFPDDDGTQDFGRTANKWNDIFLSGTLNGVTQINFGGAVDVRENNLPKFSINPGIAIGGSTSTTDGKQVSVGNQSSVGLESIAIGGLAQAGGIHAMAVGADASAQFDDAIAIGNQSTCSATGTICLGNQTIALLIDAIAIGFQANATGAHSICIGDGSTSNALNAICIGPGVSNGTANSCVIGSSANIRASQPSTCDVGTTSTRFKDIWLSGSVLGAVTSRAYWSGTTNTSPSFVSGTRMVINLPNSTIGTLTDFTINASTGQVTYTGTNTREFNIVFNITLQYPGSGSQMTHWISKNAGSPPAAPTQARAFFALNANNFGVTNQFTLFDRLSLATNDTFQLAALLNATDATGVYNFVSCLVLTSLN